MTCEKQLTQQGVSKRTRLLKTAVSAALVLLLAAVLFTGAVSADGEYVKVWNGTELQSLADGDVVAGSSGTATLTGTPGTTDPCILELNNFVVDASAAGTMIIDSNVPNLTINLVGTSDLKANLSDDYHGAVYAAGSLIIKAASGSDAELNLNNTVASGYSNGIYAQNISVLGGHTTVDVLVNSSDSSVYSIYASNAICIDDATVYATARTVSGYYCVGIDAYNRDLTITGAKVTAKTLGGYSQYPICSDCWDLSIEDSIVDAYGYTDYSDAEGYGIYAYYNITISDSQVIANITVEDVDDSDYVSAIYSHNGGMTIENSIVNAISEIGDDGDDYGDAYGIFLYDGEENLLISNSAVTAKAAGGKTYDVYGIKHYGYGDILITDKSIVDVYGESDSDYSSSEGYGIYAYYNLTISDSQVTAKTQGEYSMYPIYADDAMSIEDSIVDVYGESDVLESYGYGIYADDDLEITDSTVDVTMDAPDGYMGTYSDDLSISSSSINVNVTSVTYTAYAIYADYALDITDSFINAAARTKSGSYSVGLEANGDNWDDMHITNSTILVNCTGGSPYPICADYGSIFVEDSIIDAYGYTDDPDAEGYGFYASYDLDINASVVNAEITAPGSDFSGYLYSLFAYYYNVTISNDSVVRAAASGNNSYGIVAGDSLVMNSPGFVSAFGTNSSFAAYEGMDIESLSTGYYFLNETNPASEPTSFDNFSCNWHIAEKVVSSYSYNISNYTSVCFAKGTTITLDPNGGACDTPAVLVLYGTNVLNTTISTPELTGYTFAGWFDADDVKVIGTDGNLVVSAYTDVFGNWAFSEASLTLYAKWTQNHVPSGSSKQSGSSVWLTATPTPVPTSAAPAAEPTQGVPSASPVNPQPTQTSASPAPFAGILAGLGAAAALAVFRRK